MKLCVFDFDSTLMDGETIDFLAKELSFEKEVSTITEKAMRGELDFFESLTKRVHFLKGLQEKAVDEICHNLPYMNGAVETIRELKKHNYTVIVFSGGFRNATNYAKEILGYDADFANILHVKNDILTGLVGGDMMFNYSKGDMLQRIQSLLKISQDNTMVVGDGANDLSMFEFAKTRVAFCAKEILKKEANVIIGEKDLTKILEEVVCI